MKTILLIDGSKKFAHSNGELNKTYINEAVNFCLKQNHTILKTEIDAGYDIANEIEKFLQADIVIWQIPAWWMGAPWIVKKYIDDVFTEGYQKLYESDGRTRSNSEKKYGSGGLLQGKKYMFSITWNAPKQAFEDKQQFFEGKGVDGVLFPMYKACQFIGMSHLPTFMCNDVIKNPTIKEDLQAFNQHLEKYLK